MTPPPEDSHINISIPRPLIDGGLSERLSEHGEKLASIATDISLLRKELLGNGQPGRLTQVENDVKRLNHLRGYVYGAWGAVMVIAGAIAWVLTR